MEPTIEEIIQGSNERFLNTKKTCSRCFQLKPLLEFKKNSASSYGKSSWCKKCHREYNRNYQRNMK